ncbi:hypothetical protein IE53DRAFT_185741 [Violaceomyces palustris]|uniref:Uncharacterized protein n=1 Tax=Violaceomyces palustris TaxID=1673888 RepID=A0ACD0NS27_9BASI|nr:hypothetical protein IE53DRAFT_185741 [Violaceomyces palustris]
MNEHGLPSRSSLSTARPNQALGPIDDQPTSGAMTPSSDKASARNPLDSPTWDQQHGTAPTSGMTTPAALEAEDLKGYDLSGNGLERRYPQLGQDSKGQGRLRKADEASWAIWILAFCAALSGSIFGYDTGYISSVLVNIDQDLGRSLTSLDKELITSATSLGALLGALCAGILGDWLGRKAVIAIANVIFVVGAIVQAACHEIYVMIIGRLIVGLGVGVASMIVPLWIGELAPTHLRGRLVTVNVVFITLGQVIAYGVGAGFESIKGGWRFTVAGGAVPAFLQLASMLWLPESPRYDIKKGRIEKVARTFQRIFPHATYEECLEKAEVISANVEAARQQGSSVSMTRRLKSMVTIGANRRALFVACGLQALQQLCGFNTLMYYSATIFSAIGFSNPTAVSLIISVTNFLSTLVALKYIDIVGRRRIMLWTVPGMAIGLVFGAVCFHFLTLNTGNQLDPVKFPGYQYPTTWSSLLIVAMIFYVASYGLGVGNVPWQQGELFGIETRAIGTSLSTATNWGCNLLIGATYLSLMSAITPAGAFGFYAGLCALGWVACIFGFPDTRRLSLEEVQSIFDHSWGIQAADDLRREKDRALALTRLRSQDESNDRVIAATTAIDVPGLKKQGGDLKGAVAEPTLEPSSSTAAIESQPADKLAPGQNGGLDRIQGAKKDQATPPTARSEEDPAPVTLSTSASTSPWDDALATPAPCDGEDAGASASAWKPPSDGKMSGSSPAVPSQIPASAMSRSSSPHAHQRNYSTTSLASNASGRSIKAPKVSEGNTSPLARLGIKGDGLMLFVTCFASLGVFLFGYDQGVMSGIITDPYFKAFFNQPTSYEVGTLVASLELGALVTSLACGRLADIFGRKKTLFCGAVIFSIGGLVQTFTTGYNSMLIGRVISGLGVGVLSMIVPTYQSEISPAENRGKLACIEFTGNVFGYASSVWVDYLSSFIPSDMSWRLPLSLQAVIGTILAIGSLLLPESPRWLLDQDRDEEGMRVLADLHGGGDPSEPRAKLEFREIKENVLLLRSQGDNSYSTMWKKYKYRTLIAMSSQAFAQLNGINVISYYAPLVFESAGWIGRDAILMTGINGTIYVLATIPTWFLVDLWGRRIILLSGAIICGAALSLCGWFLYIDESYTPQAVVGCVIVYNAFFGYSWGPIPWMYPPEIMPLAFRAKGASLSTATNWLFNWAIGEATPILQETIKWRLYPMHAFFCALSFVVVYFGYPETAGVPLEEIGALFGDEINVPQDEDSDDEETGDGRIEFSPERRRVTSEDHGGVSETDGLIRPPRPLRRSISSHPRFQSEEERAARVAAARVAAEERRQAESFFGFVPRGIRGAFGRLLGGKQETPDRRLYDQLRRDEH